MICISGWKIQGQRKLWGVGGEYWVRNQDFWVLLVIRCPALGRTQTQSPIPATLTCLSPELWTYYVRQQHGRSRKAFGAFPELTDRSLGGHAGGGEKHRPPVLKGATEAGQKRSPCVSAARGSEARPRLLCLLRVQPPRHLPPSSRPDTVLCRRVFPLLRGFVEGPRSCQKNVG